MTFVASVLYEDKAAPGEGGRRFAVHQLVLACVADLLPHGDGGPRTIYDLREVIAGIARNGRDNVLKDCVADRWTKFSPGGQPVFAVVDHDRIHDTKGEHALMVTKGACFTEIRKAFRKHVQESEQVRIILLRDNLESLFRVVHERGLLEQDMRPLLVRVIAKSGVGLIDRDTVLNALAFADDRGRRDVLCEAVPSFGYLVRSLAALVVPA